MVGCRINAICPLVGPGPVGEHPRWEASFYGILARIYKSFGENHGKLRTARQAQPRIEPATSHLPALSAGPLHH